MIKILPLMLIASLSSCAIEKPPYQSLKKDGNFELRKYNTISIVSAPMENMDNRDTSFRKLFKYISGENQKNQKIEMTSPVFMDEKSNPKNGTMSFMIPAAIAKNGSPSPNAGELTITEIKGGKFATLRFTGWQKEDSRNKASEALSALITQNNLKPLGEKIFAIYDPPWTPEPFRTNEIWQRVED